MSQPASGALQPTIEFPPDLPVSARRADIEAALRSHQVVVVCGETGSGKTTQLPKIALAMGRGRMNAPPGQRGRLIGHTQPRRIAATSVARRIADELKTPLGEVVGYKVRFNDRLSAGASIKLMTDGILLAETQTDPLLKNYDTLIIDEAHERSLNIDFLLGYLKQILPRRPDLKLIVTSATIDADRFAQHFAMPRRPAAGPPQGGAAPSGGSATGEAVERGGLVPAPVLLVSGRMYPVEQRWRPFEESRDHDLNDAIAEAVDEVWTGRPAGDILIFLPGEREIRDAAEHLRGHLARSPLTRGAEVLPLFARLSQAEQDRVFDTHGAPRIVIATNVAETSLTVPGIKYVIDPGTARVKRYSYRSKVEQLLVEPVSQAAANQRAGRCGRVSDGICIRLYDEKDFAGRPRFTDPEILRSSLAAVILRMKSLHLGGEGGRVGDFPFLDAPSGRAIADGIQLLQELGAMDEAQALTALGHELSRLPLDPRVGRMILAARERGALREVLVIAAALSVQDVRDRPLEQQAQADQAHAKFDDEKSEFSGYLRLWKWLHDARGGQVVRTRREMAAAEGKGAVRKSANLVALPAAQRAALAMEAARKALGGSAAAPAVADQPTHKLSNRQWENLLRQNFISVRRVREWRDIHTQLHTVVAEHGWMENARGPAPGRPKPGSAPSGGSADAQRGAWGHVSAGYEALHKSLLAGLLGNVGHKLESDDAASGEYLGARGIKFHRHPGAHLSKRPGRWIVAAELVETTRLFGRGIATIEPQWLEEVGGHLLKKQLLEPHWEKKAQDVVALERATLYGLVVYSGRRRSYGAVDPQAAREIFIREALVNSEWPDDWTRRLPFLQANQRAIAKVEELEHKSRRQDVLVDDELIYAFYDSQIPAGISNGRDFERWWREASQANPKLLQLTREELMRHEAAGITSAAFPKMIRLGGVDCAASYLHEPGDAKDGLTVTVPLFVLNQVSEARCEWLVPGMLKPKIQALLKSLPQRPRSRFVPLPESAARLNEVLGTPEAFGHGSLTDALLKLVREATGLDVRRTDFKLDMLPAHLFMNFRVVDEHGRQRGQGRNLAALKAELGGEARGAFQALAGLKVAKVEIAAPPAGSGREAPSAPAAQAQAAIKKSEGTTASADTHHTTWDFGELPELMEIRRKGQTLIGFPALIDAGDAVTIEVFDEPELAAAKHRVGLRRLFALQLRDALKYLEKNVPDLQKMSVAYMPLGTAEELRQQIIDVALERAFLVEPLPMNEAEFRQRMEEGRARLTLIANEIARLAGVILGEYASAARKIKDTRNSADATRDASEQLQRLMPKNFLAATPWSALQHFPRYLKAIVLRLDKLRADPARDAQRMAEVRTQDQRFWRLVAERKGQQDARLQELRWLLEELRVSFFAQELRTPQPVSIKRLDKVWAQVQG
ncbi:ATP-dependent RNA helicase HrpA [Ottowia sp.]|uniref:ATP-dependent RNA helicase HrpA n=1 Tax=Ottowia sp. TaxID=1898956 RepID=UPI002B6B3E7A|nr:ATP-dependent RNA helicase HrpA [Ottowia sp.]HRN76312.1 ATP-dependent RNA helicase HrpA [Ottowia sp.]HRQ02703.1 ATP-dependent RNA helicase HrpA [Ottowia sp.]